MTRFTLIVSTLILPALLTQESVAQSPTALSLPPEWVRVGPPEAIPLYEVSLDRDVKRGGETSLRVRPRSPEANQYGTVLSQSFLADAFRGQRVRLTGHVRGLDVGGMGRLWIRVDGSAEGTPFDNMSDRAVTGTSDWRQYDLVVDVPRDATVIHIGIIFGGPGTLWVDDLAFGPVGSNVTLSGELREVVSRPPAEANLRKAPVNLGFEPSAMESFSEPSSKRNGV